MSDGARQAGIAMGLEQDRDLLASHRAVAETGTNRVNEVISMPAKGSNTAGAWGTPSGRAAIVEVFGDLLARALATNWPTDRLWYVGMPADVYAEMVKYVALDKQLIGSGQVNDAGFVRGVIGQTLGFVPVFNNQIEGDNTAAGTGQYPLPVGIAGDTLHFAEQYSLSEVMRAPGFFGYHVRGARRWGSKVRENARRMEVNFTFTS